MSSAKRLAREILDTRRLALGHATSPQLTSSALDGGQLDINDSDGNRIGGIGLGDDGGFVIDYSGGPKPPKPSPPTVTADAGIFRIEWDGSFVNEGDEGVLATSDTDRVEIHASMDENFVPDRVESFGGAFATLDGGSFTLGPLPEAGTYYFRLVARSKSAQFSEPSERVEQTLAITSIDLEVIDAWLTGEAAQTTADGKNSIWRGPDEPVADPDAPFKDGDIWFEMTEDGKSIPNIWDETTGAWVGNDDYRQSEIERVQQELREDLDAIVVDGSGAKNFYRGTMPTDAESSEGDLWFDSSDKNKPYIYQNGEWITVRDSFTKTGVGDIAIGWGLGATRADIFDGQVTTVDGFQFGTDPNNVTVATVPSGDGTGTAKLYVPLRGTVTYDGVTVSDGRDPYDAGYSLGWSTIGNGIEGVKFKVASGAPTASLIMWAKIESTGEEATHTYPFDISAYTSSDMTHQALPSETIDLVMGLYPPLATCSFAIMFEVPDDPGNYVRGDQIAGYAQLIEPGISDGAITETKISDDSISTPKLQSKVITTDKIATGAITAESGIIGSINAGTITVGEMDGARIKAQSIAADRVLIGDGSELMPDEYGLSDTPWYANFDGGAGTGWSAEAAYPGQSRGVVLAHKPTGTSNMSLYANTLLPDHQIAVRPGETYQIFTWVYATGPVSGFSTGVAMQVYGYSNGAYKTNTRAGSALATFPSGEWVKVGGVWTAPAGIDKFSPRLTVYYPAGASTNSAKFYLGRVSVKRQVGATLIEGGAITTEHIRTGAITAESGIIGSIDANVITVGKIMGNQLDADAINGKTITGATIRTASSGSRVELTHNGLKQYNSLGATIVDMTAGSFTLQGGSITGSTIKTASSGSRVEINTQGLKQYNSKNEVIAEMVAGSMVMRGVLEQTNSIGRLQVGPTFGSGNVSPGISWSDIPGDAYGAGIGVATGTNTVALVMQGPGGSSAASRINLFKERAYIASYAAGNSYLNMADKSVLLRAQDPAGDAVGFFSANTTATTVSAYKNDLELWGGGGTRMVFSSDSSGQQIYSTSIRDRTYSTSANMCITSYGTLGKISSARRFKLDEEPIPAAEYADALLSIDYKSWVDKTQQEEYERYLTFREAHPMDPVPRDLGEAPQEPPTRAIGAVAEDFEDAGLYEFVTYDQFGQTSGLQYDRIGVALIPIVKQLRDRVEELEALVAA